jgi:hypothetical protein
LAILGETVLANGRRHMVAWIKQAVCQQPVGEHDDASYVDEKKEYGLSH